MLNNSYTEADNMQLYLGYGGSWVLSLPEFEAQITDITLQAEQGRGKTRPLCIKGPTKRHNEMWRMEQ